VAVRVAADASAELKRLYVRPDGRGHGAANALVGAAVDAAAARGARTMWLETKPGLMDHAIAVYDRHGFRRSHAPAALPVDGVVHMHRDLVAARRAS
jgi:carbonic anhydrase